jgi:hypothetical protein
MEELSYGARSGPKGVDFARQIRPVINDDGVIHR